MFQATSPPRSWWGASLRFGRQQSGVQIAVVLLVLVTLLGTGCNKPIAVAQPTPSSMVASPTTDGTARTRTASLTRTPAPSNVAPAETVAAGVRAKVVDVVDGDSIKVSLDGRTHSVRYIGIDAPEMGGPHWPAEWMGPEATAKNTELVAGRCVILEKDVSETDRFGRLLRYVYVDDRMVNAELVRLGYARARSYPPDVKHQDLLRGLETEARAAERGLWGPTPTPASTPRPRSP